MGRSAAPSELISTLRHLRASRGWSQDALAKRTGITRQSVNAIEAGRYIPNTAVALRLAKALGCDVEDIFRLSHSSDVLSVENAGATHSGDRVIVARVGERLISRPLKGGNAFTEGFRPADGIAGQGSGLTLMVPRAVFDSTAFIVGCDPSLSIVAARVSAASPDCRLVWLHGDSRNALRAMTGGHAHIAGIHLRDPKGNDYNLTHARSALPGGGHLLAYASWDQGLMVAHGNPHRIRRVEDLANPRIRIVNREIGSGSRGLLDRLVREARLKPAEIAGYDAIAKTHTDIARAIVAGAADAGVGLRAVAVIFGLEFVPLAPVRFDLVVPAEHRGHPAIRVLQDVLASATTRSELGALPGYDVGDLGSVRAEFKAA